MSVVALSSSSASCTHLFNFFNFIWMFSRCLLSLAISSALMVTRVSALISPRRTFRLKSGFIGSLRLNKTDRYLAFLIGLDHPILSYIADSTAAATSAGSKAGDMLSSVSDDTLEKASANSFLTLSRWSEFLIDSESWRWRWWSIFFFTISVSVSALGTVIPDLIISLFLFGTPKSFSMLSAAIVKFDSESWWSRRINRNLVSLSNPNSQLFSKLKNVSENKQKLNKVWILKGRLYVILSCLSRLFYTQQWLLFPTPTRNTNRYRKFEGRWGDEGLFKFGSSRWRCCLL